MSAIAVNRKQKAITASLPPPIGGLNARDPLADMDEKDAITLTNYFPENNYVALRRGYATHTDLGTAEPVESLMTYGATSGAQILIAASSGSLFDATGTATTISSTAFSSDRWQYVNITTPGGHFMLMFNGTDEGQTFDGSTLTPNGFTASGLTTADFVNVTIHKERVWLCQDASLNAWYGGTQSIAGALSIFPLGSFCELGGKLLAAGTMSTTAGITPDDFLCFVTDQGEVLIYQGTDPASADTWGLAERLRIGQPIGNRCIVRIGGDLAVITVQGVVSIRKAMQYARGQQDRAAITDKIQDHFNAHAREGVGYFGWEALMYPKGHYVLFNIPTAENVRQHQMVMNANTGAWCEFSGQNANCWALLDNSLGVEDLFFGGNTGIVYQADTTYTDNGAVLTGTIKGAFTYMGTRQQKYWTMMRPIFTSNGSPNISIGLSTDFGDALPTSVITPAMSNSAVWDQSQWDQSQWGGTTRLTKEFQTVGAIGFCCAVNFQCASLGQSCRVMAFDIVGLTGGVL